ncbi:MAG: hypothetical protein PUG43_04885 [Clostridiales bacterium]|nr:hypothetical protein [Clostridiales bacterium]MDD7347839.1 hypothetical protein [Clostridiales bacterium]MDY4060853.1 hypothetical protein [Anaerovoracaceae bacterium]
MSRFLGPIHHWLYEKIKFQEELTQDIAKLALQNNWLPGGEQFANSLTRTLSPLEEVIDESNIHGWLQDRIFDAEKRYGYLIAEILKCAEDQIRHNKVSDTGSFDTERMEELKREARAFGARHAMKPETTPEEAYRTVENCFVSGMPCDRVNQVVEKTEDVLSWKETVDIHHGYHEGFGGGTETYYMLKAEIISGMLTGTGLEFRSEPWGQSSQQSEAFYHFSYSSE